MTDVKKRGRPVSDKKALTNAERQRLYRERKKQKLITNQQLLLKLTDANKEIVRLKKVIKNLMLENTQLRINSGEIRND